MADRTRDESIQGELESRQPTPSPDRSADTEAELEAELTAPLIPTSPPDSSRGDRLEEPFAGSENVVPDLDPGVKDVDRADLRPPEGHPGSDLEDLLQRGDGLGYLGEVRSDDGLLLPGDNLGDLDGLGIDPGGILDRDMPGLSGLEGSVPDLLSAAAPGADPRIGAEDEDPPPPPPPPPPEEKKPPVEKPPEDKPPADKPPADAGPPDQGTPVEGPFKPLVQVGKVYAGIQSILGIETQDSSKSAPVGVRGTPDPEDGGDEGYSGPAPAGAGYGSAPPVGSGDGPEVPEISPATNAWDQPLDAESAMQPAGDDPDGLEQRGRLSLEDAIDGDVDPYAMWTEDHVDTPDFVEVQPGGADDDLIDPSDPDAVTGLNPLGDGPGDVSDGDGLEDTDLGDEV